MTAAAPSVVRVPLRQVLAPPQTAEQVRRALADAQAKRQRRAARRQQVGAATRV